MDNVINFGTVRTAQVIVDNSSIANREYDIVANALYKEGAFNSIHSGEVSKIIEKEKVILARFAWYENGDLTLVYTSQITKNDVENTKKAAISAAIGEFIRMASENVPSFVKEGGVK